MEGQEQVTQEQEQEVEFVGGDYLQKLMATTAPVEQEPAPVVENPTPEPPQQQAPPVAEPPAQEPTPTQEPVVTEPPPLPKIEYAPAPQQELKPEDIVQKFEDKTALLKALGFDDYLIGAAQHYQQTGDMTPYLEVKSVDYNKLPEDKIVERKLREQYANTGLPEEDLKMLIEDEMLNRYKQDDQFSEKEVQLGKIKMKADAAEYRKQFVERQAKFAPPPPPQREEQAPEPTDEEITTANMQRVLADSYVQQFVKSPVIKIGEGQEAFNYQSKNPNALLGVLTDHRQTAYYTSKKDDLGRIVVDAYNNPVPDYELMMEIAAHMVEGKNYNKYILNHGKSLGTKSIAEEINPTPPIQQGAPPAQELDEMQQLAAALRGRGY